MVSLKSRMLALVANSPASPQLNPLLLFKASWSWASGFMRRFNWSLRAFTTKVKAADTSKGCDFAAKVDNFPSPIVLLRFRRSPQTNSNALSICDHHSPSMMTERTGHKRIEIALVQHDRGVFSLLIVITLCFNQNENSELSTKCPLLHFVAYHSCQIIQHRY
jgi:hypothetical protein